VTCPDTKVLSPYKPLRKKERKKGITILILLLKGG